MDKYLVKCEVKGTEEMDSYVAIYEMESEALLAAKESLLEFETKCGMDRTEFYFNSAYETLTFEGESFDGKTEQQITICIGPIELGEKIKFYGFTTKGK